MKNRVLAILLISLFIAVVFLPTGCVLKNKFANDPVKWSFVSGDGTWDANSRKWTVDLRPDETKTVTIQLFNSSSVQTTVIVNLGGPPDTISLRGAGRYIVGADQKTNITLAAIAYEIAAPGSQRYIVDCSYSFNIIEP
jgi:hypothetical protein